MECDRNICVTQDYNGGCETCICNENNNPECCYEIEREINEILWHYFFKDSYDYGESFQNEIFIIKPYNWNDFEENNWNFYHIPSGLKIQWYKYPLRNPMSNMEITHEKFLEVLKDCYNSIEKTKHSLIKCYFNCYPWWE